jgi:NAD(P)H-dependent flavin oxidoreductase YrpB (nitropropane dioxygenase family)
VLRTGLCRELGIEYPIFSVGFARMAGPELAAAVSNAGARAVSWAAPASRLRT